MISTSPPENFSFFLGVSRASIAWGFGRGKGEGVSGPAAAKREELKSQAHVFGLVTGVCIPKFIVDKETMVSSINVLDPTEPNLSLTA